MVVVISFVDTLVVQVFPMLELLIIILHVSSVCRWYIGFPEFGFPEFGHMCNYIIIMYTAGAISV